MVRGSFTSHLMRLHGGTEKPLSKLLSEFKPSMTQTELSLRSKYLLNGTKGGRRWPEQEFAPVDETYVAPFRRFVAYLDGKRSLQSKQWTRASESHTFNRIEKIAPSSSPFTPFLGGRLTRALELRFVSTKYVSAKMNWVLKSSAAGSQHLQLLSIKNLFETFKIKGRLVLTLNDGMKTLVKSEQRYKAALALHISNLHVKSFLAEGVGMDDLPQSVAFHPFVTVDKVLQRDVLDDCITPSNPYGLRKTYGIPPGERLDIYETLHKLGGSSS